MLTRTNNALFMRIHHNTIDYRLHISISYSPRIYHFLRAVWHILAFWVLSHVWELKRKPEKENENEVCKYGFRFPFDQPTPSYHTITPSTHLHNFFLIFFSGYYSEECFKGAILKPLFS